MPKVTQRVSGRVGIQTRSLAPRSSNLDAIRSPGAVYRPGGGRSQGGRRGAPAASALQAREVQSLALAVSPASCPPTAVSPSVIVPRPARPVTPGTRARSLAYDLYTPPPPPPSSHAKGSRLRCAAGAPRPPAALPEPAGETAAGGPRPRRGGSARRPRSPARPRRRVPRPERTPAPLARCGVSVSPAGFSPLRWSGK